MKYLVASRTVSFNVFDRHSVLDVASPVLDMGESNLVFWIPAGVYPPQAGRYDERKATTNGQSLSFAFFTCHAKAHRATAGVFAGKKEGLDSRLRGNDRRNEHRENRRRGCNVVRKA
jgi:hypothetical protein